MINAIYEYRKGAFFVRPRDDAKEENIYEIITKAGMKDIVINIKEVKETNKISSLINDFINSKCNIYLICNKKDKENYQEKYKSIRIIENELEVFKQIEV